MTRLNIRYTLVTHLRISNKKIPKNEKKISLLLEVHVESKTFV